MGNISYMGGNYRLSRIQKNEIANNLIKAAKFEECPNSDTMNFINEWCCIGTLHKKLFIDVWDIVLNNYMPNTIPENATFLFRVCEKRSRLIRGKIKSYSNSFENTLKWKKEKIIVLELNEAVHNKEWYNNDSFTGKNRFVFSFYPLVEVMKHYIPDFYYIPEGEYIVRETDAGVTTLKVM